MVVRLEKLFNVVESEVGDVNWAGTEVNRVRGDSGSLPLISKSKRPEGRDLTQTVK